MTEEQKTNSEGTQSPAKTAGENTEVKVETQAAEVKTESAPSEAPKEAPKDPRDTRRGSFGNRGGQGGRGRGGPGGRGGRRGPQRREKPEFDQKIVSLRRVTRVMAGGRRFSFSAAIVIGDRKGKVGFGIGKANDTTAAIEKAVRVAKKNMLVLKRTDINSIPHDSQAKYKGSDVLLRPVSGKGLAAGGGVRVVLELAGIDEVGGKLLSRSKNNINNAKATLRALLPFATNRDSVKI